MSKVELMQVNEHVSSKPYFKYTEVNCKDCLLIPRMVSVKE